MPNKLSIQDREINNQLDRIYGTDKVSIALLNPEVHIAILHNHYFENTPQQGVHVVCKTDIERIELARDIVEDIGGKYRNYVKIYLPASIKYTYLLSTSDNRFSLVSLSEIINLQKLLVMWNKAEEEIKKVIKDKISTLLLSYLDTMSKRVIEGEIKVTINKKSTKEVSNAPVVNKKAKKKTDKKTNSKKPVRRAK